MEHSALLKIKNRSESAYQKLFLEFYAPLVSFAMNIVHSKDIAEDLVQDIFIKIWEGRNNIEEIKNISAYLYQAVKFSCYNFNRDKKNFTSDNSNFADNINSSSCIEELIIEEESFRFFLKEMENLPPKCKKIFSLSLNGLMAKEIAEELDIAIETVKKQKKIAKRMLREKINKFLTFLLILVT